MTAVRAAKSVKTRPMRLGRSGFDGYKRSSNGPGIEGTWTMRREPIQILAGATALVAWTALGVQLAIMLNAMTLVPALWRFAGFYTILTNLLVAIMATEIASGRTDRLSGPVARMAVTAAIVLVGVVYWALLAPLWTPTGWQLAADIGLHAAVPVLALGLWFATRDGSLGWRDVPRAAIWPAIYGVYAVARGAFDGWYAYWFLNPNDQSPLELLVSIVGVATLVMAIGALLVAIDRKRPLQT